MRLATAESCTGGLIGHLLTEISGSSDYYLGGVVSYGNEVKVQVLRVPPATVGRYGAVSGEVAGHMAQGVLEMLGADLAVAVTGIAGPEGGSVEKPVGLTFVAAARRDGTKRVERHRWPHDRAGNKRAAAVAALRLVTQLAEGEAEASPGTSRGPKAA